MKHKTLDIKGLVYYWEKDSNFKIHINRFNIYKGQKVILLGDSGCGKSTFLNLINGILNPIKGKVSINNTEITSLRSKEKDLFRARHIGVIFQQFNLIEYISPMTNIILPGFFTKSDNKDIKYLKEKAFNLGSNLGLEKKILLKNNSKNLSVGQQQRIAIIRSLINSPQLVLADEPTSALDKSNQKKFMRMLLEFCEKENTTLLMVSHDNTLSSNFDKKILFKELLK